MIKHTWNRISVLSNALCIQKKFFDQIHRGHPKKLIFQKIKKKLWAYCIHPKIISKLEDLSSKTIWKIQYICSSLQTLTNVCFRYFIYVLYVYRAIRNILYLSTYTGENICWLQPHYFKIQFSLFGKSLAFRIFHRYFCFFVIVVVVFLFSSSISSMELTWAIA